jgi:hypothetical protein
MAQEVSVTRRAANSVWGPAEFIRILAGELTSVSLKAHLANSDGSYYITVGGLAGMGCEVIPGDGCGSVACCYWPDPDVAFGAVNVIGLVMSLLPGENVTGELAPNGQLAAGHSLASVAGQELKARGLDVWLHVDTNQVLFEAVTELTVTCSDGNNDPRVFIDEGGAPSSGRTPPSTMRGEDE